jgi:hypothetical protein
MAMTFRLNMLKLCLQEIGFTHMRVLEGVGTLIQLAGLMARLCKQVRRERFFSLQISILIMKSECEPRPICHLNFQEKRMCALHNELSQ